MMVDVQFQIVFALLWWTLENIDGAFFEVNRELRYLDISSTLAARSAIECCLLCHDIQNCRVASYHKTNRICEIGARSSIKDVYLSSAPGWDMLTLEVTCAPGWTRRKTSCYKLAEVPNSWDDAQKECERLHSGGHLADIHSEAINDLLKVLYNQAVYYTYMIWVGGCRDPEGILKWRDQSRVSDSFQNWRAGEPNFNQESENCMQVLSRFNFMWNDQQCDGWGFSFCEY